VAKEIIHLINDVAETINNDPVSKDLLKIVYPSGTGNMKFTMNGALTIGTLDGANVEIREHVGADNFFLFGMTAQEVQSRYQVENHSRKAIEASAPLQEVLQMIAEGRFNPDDKDRYHGLKDHWNRLALRNIAGSGYFSSDRTIRGYMTDIWNAKSML